MKRSAVLLVVPPWPLGGSGNIFAAQVDFHRRNGRNVFVIITNHEADFRPHGFGGWKTRLSEQFAALTSLPPEQITCATCETVPSWASRDNVIDRRFDIVKGAELDRKVIAFIRSHRITHLHVNHVYSLGLADRLRWACLRYAWTYPSLIVETHDVQSRAITVQGQAAWYGIDESEESTFATEAGLLSRADVLVHISPSDYEIFAHALPRRRHVYVRGTLAPNTERAFDAPQARTPHESCDLLYVGDANLGNVETLRAFFIDVLPRVLAVEPTFKVAIVGSVRELFAEVQPELYANVGRSFLGRVPALTEWYAGARLIYAASRNSTGSSIKLIEALCSGRPVVANTEGVRGLEGLPRCRDLVVADGDPDDLARAILATATRDAQREGISGRDLFARFFSNEAYGAAMNPIFA